MHSFFSSGSDASIFATTLFEAISRNVFCTWNVAVTPRLTGLNSRDKADFLSVSKSSPAARNKSLDRKSTRLNSSHRCISYAVFCLKKKKKKRHKIDTAK